MDVSLAQGALLVAGAAPSSLEDLFRRPAWQLDAACRYEDPTLFFPARGEPTEPAKAICSTCPVQAD